MSNIRNEVSSNGKTMSRRYADKGVWKEQQICVAYVALSAEVQ